jgi:hypothetical protein
MYEIISSKLTELMYEIISSKLTELNLYVFPPEIGRIFRVEVWGGNERVAVTRFAADDLAQAVRQAREVFPGVGYRAVPPPRGRRMGGRMNQPGT